MEGYQHMKAFIRSALDYSENHTEKTVSSLQRHLQMLGVTADMSVFDPGNSISAEFYISLHELMSGLESRSGLVWCAIGVLQHICRNKAARHALIHTYKFVPILTRLLDANLILEKRLRILQLLQDLTYGVKILWQEAHLPRLITTLTSWIISGEKDVIGLSLSILVNLCYKNLPAVYTLMRCIDNKHFLRTILKLQHDNINIRVQVCKILLILEHISGEIPDSDILNFVNVTFATIGDAFRARDVFLLKHMVDFFNDVQANSRSRDVLLTYKSFINDTEQLLLLLGSDVEDSECVGMLFEFLHSLVALRIIGFNCLYPNLVAVGMKWIPTKLASTQSLSLIRSVALDTRHNNGDSGAVEIRQQILGQLEKGLLAHLLTLDIIGNESCLINSEARARITALLQLLQEMCKTPTLRQKILSGIKSEGMCRVFQPLVSLESCDGNNLFEEEVMELYVTAVDFISDLVSYDTHWLKLYSDLLQHKQVQMVLAIAIYTGKEEVKRKVLTLTGAVGFPADSVSSLAKSLCDLEPLVLVSNNTNRNIAPGVGNGSTVQQHDMMPLFSLAQEGRLDQFIAKLQEAQERNEIHDISTSTVMELFQYKLAAMSHSDRALQLSLEAANTHATHLQHRLAQIGAEVSRLHQVLYQNQQCLEGLQQEKSLLNTRLESAQATTEQEHKKHINEMKSKHQLITELNCTIEELKRDIETKKNDLLLANQSLSSMEEKLTNQMNKNIDLTKTLSKLEDRIVKRERIIEERGSEIEKYQKVVENLEMELTNYKMLCKVQEKNLLEKEAEINATQLQLNELQRMREVIYEISGGKKKMDKD